MDIKTYLSQKHIIEEINDREISIPCPECGKAKQHFQINLMSSRAHCFRCGYKTNWPGLIAKLEHISIEEAVNIVADFNKIHPVVLAQTQTKSFPYIQLPPKSPWTLRSRRYLYERGIPNVVVDHFKLYYCGSGFFDYRIIIPIYFKGQVVGFQGRDIFNRSTSDRKKYLFPKHNSTGKMLFNYDDVVLGGPVIVVEGVFDVFNLWKRGLTDTVATFGKMITDKQVELLAELNPSPVILWYDSDADTIEKVYNKLNRKFDVEIAYQKSGDPGDCQDPYDVLNNVCDTVSDFNWKRTTDYLAEKRN